MIIYKNPELRQKILDNIRATVDKPREGIHLSDLIYCTRKAYFRKIGLAPLPSDEQCLMWLTGFAFQAYMFPLDVELPLRVEGVNCSPDVPSGIEVKSTRQSMRKFNFLSMGGWKRQILGYCKALNQLEYDLAVMFVCGNYAPPFPDIDCWHIVAEVGEVEENWDEVMRKKLILEEALGDGAMPEEPDCDDFEWKYCECVDMCEGTVCWNKKQLNGKSKRK